MQPVVKTLTVRRSPDEAFRLFTAEITRWWPLGTHHRGRLPPMACTINPGIGGRVFETGPDGTELDWGCVTDWQPGQRFAMSWAVGGARDAATEVIVTFTPATDGTEIRLVHAGWERQAGGQADERRSSYGHGWDLVFVEGYGRLAGRAGESAWGPILSGRPAAMEHSSSED